MKKVNSVCDVAKSVADATKHAAYTAREAIHGALNMMVEPTANLVESRVNTLTLGALGRWKAKRALAARRRAMVDGHKRIIDAPNVASQRMAEIRAAREEREILNDD